MTEIGDTGQSLEGAEETIHQAAILIARGKGLIRKGEKLLRNAWGLERLDFTQIPQRGPLLERLDGPEGFEAFNTLYGISMGEKEEVRREFDEIFSRRMSDMSYTEKDRRRMLETWLVREISRLSTIGRELSPVEEEVEGRLRPLVKEEEGRKTPYTEYIDNARSSQLKLDKIRREFMGNSSHLPEQTIKEKISEFEKVREEANLDEKWALFNSNLDTDRRNVESLFKVFRSREFRRWMLGLKKQYLKEGLPGDRPVVDSAEIKSEPAVAKEVVLPGKFFKQVIVNEVEGGGIVTLCLGDEFDTANRSLFNRGEHSQVWRFNSDNGYETSYAIPWMKDSSDSAGGRKYMEILQAVAIGGDVWFLSSECSPRYCANKYCFRRTNFQAERPSKERHRVSSSAWGVEDKGGYIFFKSPEGALYTVLFDHNLIGQGSWKMVVKEGDKSKVEWVDINGADGQIRGMGAATALLNGGVASIVRRGEGGPALEIWDLTKSVKEIAIVSRRSLGREARDQLPKRDGLKFDPVSNELFWIKPSHEAGNSRLYHVSLDEGKGETEISSFSNEELGFVPNDLQILRDGRLAFVRSSQGKEADGKDRKYDEVCIYDYEQREMINTISLGGVLLSNLVVMEGGGFAAMVEEVGEGDETKRFFKMFR